MMPVAVRFISLNLTVDFKATTSLGATAPNILETVTVGIKYRIAIAIQGFIERDLKLLSLSEGGAPF
jgi:hypothetical protein